MPSREHDDSTMNSIFGTIIKTINTMMVGPPTVFGPKPTSIDPYSEMEKGRVLEWWVLIADR
jgi:hypothetical protein